MGQREKARQLVRERYCFQQFVPARPDEILVTSDRVASSVKSRRGSIRNKSSQANDSRHQVLYELRGPGGLVSIATIVLSAQPVEGGCRVAIEVPDFLFQKGSLGMKPTINGSGQLDQFVRSLRTELDLLRPSK